MYTDFFGFRELPFNNTPDPRFFFSTPDHEEALASLIYAVKERKGVALLTGEIGAGKTLVTRMMLRHFGTHIAFANLNHAVQDPDDLMESICTEFDLPVKADATRTQLVRQLHDFLLEQFTMNIPVVLVLDEAQNLSVPGFEQLRMIGNLEADDAKLLQIAIVGQPELQRLFQSAPLRQLRQRIFRAFHLPALSQKATEQYIRHRLSVVSDASVDVFELDAIEAIYDAARGLPRLINTVCDNALLSAYSADRRTIDAAFVRSVIGQMMLMGDAPTGTDPVAQRTATPMPHPSAAATVPSPSVFATLPPPVAGLETLASRLGAVEYELRARTLNDPPYAPQARPRMGDRDERVTGLDLREPHPYDRDGEAGIDDLLRRVAALERRLESLADDRNGALTIHADLRAVIREGRAVAVRSESASRRLRKRDDQLRTLGGTLRQVVSDMRGLLSRAQESAAQCTRAERRARGARTRLEAQLAKVQDQREMSRPQSGLIHQTVRRDTPHARTLKVAPADSGHPPGSAGDTPKGRPASTDLQRLLHSAQHSLMGLRDLSETADGDTAEDRQTSIPTARLADQAEKLLSLVETPL